MYHKYLGYQNEKVFRVLEKVVFFFWGGGDEEEKVTPSWGCLSFFLSLFLSLFL